MTTRLTAILAADVVGYSRLMGQDQAGTLAALREVRDELLAPTIAAHLGRTVKSMGDGWIVEFPSVVDAVDGALAVQSALAGNGIIRLRIGIHVGDVVFEEDDVFGDGVNVAARLEALAEPGQVLISDSAYHSLDGKTAARFGGGALHDLKNIARPIAVWRWPADAQGHPATPRETRAAPSERPSIAVLPFENRSGDPEQDYFADGITEDVITALSKFRWLLVIARSSSFAFKGRTTDLRSVGEALGARYLLEGSVRRAGGRVRITAQLVRAADGAHLWAERFDGILEDIFDLQDQVSLDVVRAIEPSIRLAETDRVRRKPTEDLEAYELYLRAQSHFYLLTDQDNREAIALLSRALELDPGYAGAAGFLAWAHIQRAVQSWEPLPGGTGQAIALAERVLESDRADAMALALAGHAVSMLQRDLEAGRRAFEQSLAENPNSALAHALFAANRMLAGEPEQALSHAEESLILSPRDTFRYTFHFARAVALFQSGRFDEAVEAARASIADRGSFLLSRYVLIAALVVAGDEPAARTEAERLRSKAPRLDVSSMQQSAPVFLEASVSERFRKAWRDAGIPDGPG